MTATNRQSRSSDPRAVSAKVAVILVPIVLSAYFTAAAVGSPTYAWVGWLSLLPLFFAIRLLRPLRACICGAAWGASLFVFCAFGGRAEVPAAASSFVVLTGIPAVYACAAAALTRWIGFSPFVLGVAWMGAELALAPLGLHNGLLTASQGDTALMHWIGRALGYVLVGFVVAYVNALLVEVFGRVSLRRPRPFLAKRSGHGIPFLRSQIVGCLSLVTLQPSNPRAPPA